MENLFDLNDYEESIQQAIKETPQTETNLSKEATSFNSNSPKAKEANNVLLKDEDNSVQQELGSSKVILKQPMTDPKEEKEMTGTQEKDNQSASLLINEMLELSTKINAIEDDIDIEE